MSAYWVVHLRVWYAVMTGTVACYIARLSGADERANNARRRDL